MALALCLYLTSALSASPVLVCYQVAQLESLAPAVPSELEGRWELLYSDVAPFRVSPFFLTVRPTHHHSQTT
jgi:hypothetical protein